MLGLKSWYLTIRRFIGYWIGHCPFRRRGEYYKRLWVANHSSKLRKMKNVLLVWAGILGFPLSGLKKQYSITVFTKIVRPIVISKMTGMSWNKCRIYIRYVITVYLFQICIERFKYLYWQYVCKCLEKISMDPLTIRSNYLSLLCWMQCNAI